MAKISARCAKAGAQAGTNAQMSRPIGAAAIFAFLVLSVGSLTGFTPAAAAQNLSGERVVSGTVLNASSQPVAGATVFLRNEKNKAIRSFTSVANGHFQFSQVPMNQDFDLWAEKSGARSSVKTVSSWDARTHFIEDLTLKQPHRKLKQGRA